MIERMKKVFLCNCLCVNNVEISSVTSLDNIFKKLIEPNQYILRKSQNKMAAKKGWFTM